MEVPAGMWADLLGQGRSHRVLADPRRAGITAYTPEPVRAPAMREGLFTKRQTPSPCRKGSS